jgi:hypothetical protein
VGPYKCNWRIEIQISQLMREDKCGTHTISMWRSISNFLMIMAIIIRIDLQTRDLQTGNFKTHRNGRGMELARVRPLVSTP